MTKDIATLILCSLYRSNAELGDILEFTKHNCSKEEYDQIKMAIARSIHSTLDGGVDYILSLQPSLAEEIKARINEFGRAF